MNTQKTPNASNAQSTLTIAGHTIAGGESKKIEMPVARLYTDTEMTMPIYVKRAKKPGPTVFVSAAIHGDEIIGIEIIRRLMRRKQLRPLCGTLIFVPIVNVYGVLHKSRYMPDRRDLNRSFPGSEKGSLTGRFAYQFLHEIVNQCDYGIDLHTGAIHRSNYPQIRANLSDDETLALAQAFNVPVILNSDLRDGSLRQCADDSQCKILLYEAGEALRFDEFSIRAGEKGVINVLRHLGLLRQSSGKATKASKKTPVEPIVAKKSAWLRATSSGIVNDKAKMGDSVAAGDVLAEISNPFGELLDVVKAKKRGIIIGKQNIPLVQEGDAMFHVALFDELEEASEAIEQYEEAIMPDAFEWND